MAERGGAGREPIAVGRAGVAPWLERLRRRLDERRRVGLFRTAAAREPGSGLVDLSSNDYLGLRRHPRLIDAVRRAAGEGVGAGASRLAGGSTDAQARLESRFASFKGLAAARLLSTGYAANLATLTALAQPGSADLILADKLSHASLIDAAVMAGRGRPSATGGPSPEFRTFPHLDVARAREMALRHAQRHPGSIVWLVTDSVFSMDGDVADLRALGALRDELNAGRAGGGACLIVDEAHATGVLGATGAGLDEAQGRVADVVVSTASKALGSLGGVVCGPEEVVAAIDNFARVFIYSTAPPPTQVAAIDAALDVVRDEPERRERLGRVIAEVRGGLAARGWNVAHAALHPTPIIPLVIGATEAALALAERLGREGVLAPAIRPPTVAPGAARVRLSLHAGLSDEQIEYALRAIGEPPGRRERAAETAQGAGEDARCR